MCRPAQALRRRWLGRAVASLERHGACLSRCDRDTPVAAHACGAPGRPSAGRGWGGRWCRVSGTMQARLAEIATRRRWHTHVPPGAGLPQPWLGRAVTLLERHGACSSRCDSDAPVAAHACATLGNPSTSRGWGGWSRCESGTVRACLAAIAARRWRHTRVLPQAGPPPAVARGGGVSRASGTVRARLAAIATRLWRHTHVLPSVGPPPAVAGEGDRVARVALCVLVSLRSWRAEG